MQKNNNDEILDVRTDNYMHDIFSPSNPNLVKWLISHVLEKPVEDIKEEIIFKNIRLPNLVLSERSKYCDLIYVLGNQEIIVEINNNFIGSFIRNDIYAFSNIISHYSVHEEFTDEQKLERENKKLKEKKPYYQKDIETILVNLNFHKYEIDKLRPKKDVTILRRNYGGKEKILKIVDINMDFYVDKCYNDISGYEKLYKLFTIKSKEELLSIEDEKMNKYLLEYRKRVLDLQEFKEDYLGMVVFNDDIEKNVREEEIYTMGRTEGLESGITQGIAQKEREMIINMFKDKLPLKTIAKYANITVDEVKRTINDASGDSKLMAV